LNISSKIIYSKSAQFYQSSEIGPHKRCYILQNIKVAKPYLITRV